MIGADLEGADLESRVASRAASAISDDAGHIRRRFRDMRLDYTFRFDDITAKGDLAAVRAASQGTITIRAMGETQPARLRQLFVLERTGATGRSRSTCTSGCRSSQVGAAPASSEAAARIRARSASACGRRARRGSGYADLYLPVQGPCR